MKRPKEQKTEQKQEKKLEQVDQKELEQVSGGATRLKTYDYGDRTGG